MENTPVTSPTTGGHAGYIRIATEEAWATREITDEWRRMIDAGEGGPGFLGMVGHYMTSDADRPRFVRAGLEDAGELRLAHMDAAGIDHAVLALTAPGTQVLDAARGVGIAANANDELAAAVERHPSRFTGLAAVSFENVPAAVAELERAVSKLGLRGLIVNSHIRGRYLSDPEFWPILEAAEALDVPVYLHPNTPNDAMIGTMQEAGLDGAVFGFQVETSLHTLKMITSGVFDRFPRLRLVIGHLGEALPFWLYRFDYMHQGMVASRRYPSIKPLERKISEYIQDCIWITTSGMPAREPIMFTRKMVGDDHVMYAMDYPYQYVPAEVEMQDELPMSLTEKKAFFQDIAIDVFGLDAKAIGAV
ncbi:amidohydrolase [Microbacterium faecale]|uniref:Amidohydrolase n=1 Tax=Microbacterium faecale TaxID=1804630 RepID=A0A916Y4A5_9MICO|nr:amidohydrolase family protein [Microbacterium faecale]GGD29045.1 amidohydrolase [Microbacterium faecale]